MTEELPGQLSLFDRLSPGQDDEVCDECGTQCTSSKECTQISGLYDEEGDGEADPKTG